MLTLDGRTCANLIYEFLIENLVIEEFHEESFRGRSGNVSETFVFKYYELSYGFKN